MALLFFCMETRKQERWASNKDIACEKLEKKLAEEKLNEKLKLNKK